MSFVPCSETVPRMRESDETLSLIKPGASVGAAVGLALAGFQRRKIAAAIPATTKRGRTKTRRHSEHVNPRNPAALLLLLFSSSSSLFLSSWSLLKAAGCIAPCLVCTQLEQCLLYLGRYYSYVICVHSQTYRHRHELRHCLNTQ